MIATVSYSSGRNLSEPQHRAHAHGASAPFPARGWSKLCPLRGIATLRCHAALPTLRVMIRKCNRQLRLRMLQACTRMLARSICLLISNCALPLRSVVWSRRHTRGAGSAADGCCRPAHLSQTTTRSLRRPFGGHEQSERPLPVPLPKRRPFGGQERSERPLLVQLPKRRRCASCCR